jgi:DNA-binding winged helix-turn-helix (wHTH) protein
MARGDVPEMTFRFGEFRLSALSRELWLGASPVHLSPKAFQLLLCLVESRPRALSKAELLDRIWPGTFISEATLTSVVAEIREKLGDHPRQPQFLRTVHRFGYAFCGAVAVQGDLVATPSVASSCFLLGQTAEFPLVEGPNLLGRDLGGAVAIDADTVSRRHACLVVSEGKAVIEDLGSKNGTFVQGERVVAPLQVHDGDRILIGSVPLLFRVRRWSASTLTRKPD